MQILVAETQLDTKNPLVNENLMRSIKYSIGIEDDDFIMRIITGLWLAPSVRSDIKLFGINRYVNEVLIPSFSAARKAVG